MQDFKNNLILYTKSAREALTLLDLVPAASTLFAIDENDKMKGTVTDGDIRRGLLNGLSLETSIDKYMNTSFRYLRNSDNLIASIQQFREKKILLVPLLDSDNRIIRVLDLSSHKSLLPLDAVIMAGGRGERLKPYTEHLPKPMLLVGDKPIIEHNINRLISYGIDNIHININYLGEKISSHLGDGSSRSAKISYVNESVPLGTAGALKLHNNFANDVILLMNADLLTNIDLEGFYLEFTKSEADMSVATIPYNIQIPYGVLDINDVSEITGINEKPTYTYYSNSGIYLLKKEVIDLIPENIKFNATDLIEVVIKKRLKLTSFPILDYWLDIGKTDDYHKAQKDIYHIKF